MIDIIKESISPEDLKETCSVLNFVGTSGEENRCSELAFEVCRRGPRKPVLAQLLEAYSSLSPPKW